MKIREFFKKVSEFQEACEVECSGERPGFFKAASYVLKDFRSSDKSQGFPPYPLGR